jgi:hypothetical protein
LEDWLPVTILVGELIEMDVSRFLDLLEMTEVDVSRFLGCLGAVRTLTLLLPTWIFRTQGAMLCGFPRVVLEVSGIWTSPRRLVGELTEMDISRFLDRLEVPEMDISRFLGYSSAVGASTLPIAAMSMDISRFRRTRWIVSRFLAMLAMS